MSTKKPNPPKPVRRWIVMAKLADSAAAAMYVHANGVSLTDHTDLARTWDTREAAELSCSSLKGNNPGYDFNPAVLP